MSIIRPQFSTLLLAFTLLALSGCFSMEQDEVLEPSPVQVSVMTLQPQDLRQIKALPGRVSAFRSAEIRAQVSGILQHRLFEQGADIAKGTVLYQINAAPFQAEVDSAAAALAKAEAVAKRAALEANRLAQLHKTGVVSRQHYDDAVSLHAQAIADVSLAKATLNRRKLDLQFARVEAPIAGRIDQTLVSEGALVSPTDATPLARIQQIDQVYVDVRLSAELLPALQQSLVANPLGAASATSVETTLPIEILSSSGEPTGMHGRALFVGSEVDSGTGDVLLRVLVQNPKHHLLPGLYVQARVQLAYYQDALFVPQQAVSRINGQATVWLLDGQSRVQAVAISVAELVDGQFRVDAGLTAGQQLVVEGTERLSPSLQVNAQSWPVAVSRQQTSSLMR